MPTLKEKRALKKRVKTTKRKLKEISKRLSPKQVRAFLDRIDPPDGSKGNTDVDMRYEPRVLAHAEGCASRNHAEACAINAEPVGHTPCSCSPACDCGAEAALDVTKEDPNIPDAPWWECQYGHKYQSPEWSYQTRSAVAPATHLETCKAGPGSTYICECPPRVLEQDTGPLCNVCWEDPAKRALIAAYACQVIGTHRIAPPTVVPEPAA